MNNKKAIQNLKSQIEKLDNPKIYKDENWIFQTASYIKDFFGQDSAQYTFISNFNFKIPFNQYDSKTFASKQLNLKILKSRQYLENCIETINVKGLYKHPKTNFLNRISETALWSIITVLLPIIFFSGYYFGNLYSNTQNIELKIENKTLKDSLFIFRKHPQNISEKQANKINSEN
jgi:hypothetical protein